MKNVTRIWGPDDTAETVADWNKHTDQAISVVRDDLAPVIDITTRKVIR